MVKPGVVLWLVVAVAAGFDDFSPEMKEMIARQRQTIEKINAIKAEAVKDESGKVTPQEYGRLLTKVVEVTGGYKSLKDLPHMIEEYVGTLTEPQDPEELLMDLGIGKFSQILMEAVNKDMRRAMKHDL